MSKPEAIVTGPSWTEVILGALLSVLLGMVLAAAFLVFKPTVTVKELPKEPVAGIVYFIEGSRESSKARQLPAKQAAILQGASTVTLIEDEINLLVAQSASTKAAPKNDAAPAPAATAAVTASTPNFRIREGVMQIGLPVHVNALGLTKDVVIQTRGGFEKRGDVFVFTPSEFYVGSLPIQRLPVIEDLLFRRLLAAAAVPAELSEAWQKLSDVAVEGAALRLAMP